MTDTAVAEKSAQLRDGRTAAILRPSEITPRARVGGARTLPMVSRQVGAKDFLNGITAFPPGAAIPEHFHNCDESVMILRGSAVAHIDGQPVPGRRRRHLVHPGRHSALLQECLRHRRTPHLLDLRLDRR